MATKTVHCCSLFCMLSYEKRTQVSLLSSKKVHVCQRFPVFFSGGSPRHGSFVGSLHWEFARHTNALQDLGGGEPWHKPMGPAKLGNPRNLVAHTHMGFGQMDPGKKINKRSVTWGGVIRKSKFQPNGSWRAVIDDQKNRWWKKWQLVLHWWSPRHLCLA